MAEKKTPIVVSFNVGEVTPELDVRIDTDAYKNGCRMMENTYPLVQGGAARMPGTVYVTVVKGD
jgi:hypothetical protein